MTEKQDGENRDHQVIPETMQGRSYFEAVVFIKIFHRPPYKENTQRKEEKILKYGAEASIH